MLDFLENLLFLVSFIIWVILIIRLTNKRIFTKAKRPLNFYDYWLTAFILSFPYAIFMFSIMMVFSFF